MQDGHTPDQDPVLEEVISPATADSGGDRPSESGTAVFAPSNGTTSDEAPSDPPLNNSPGGERLESEVAGFVEDVLEGYIQDPDERQRAVLSIAMRVEAIASPYLPPSYLREYEQLVPGSAAKTFELVEKQSTHRQELESSVVHGNERRADRGQWLGLAVALSFLAAATVLIALGHDAAGTILGSVDLVSLVGIFVFGKTKQAVEIRRPDPPASKVLARPPK